MTIKAQFESYDELKTVLNAIQDSISANTNKRTLNPTEHRTLTTVYERFYTLLPPPPKPELTPEQERIEMIGLQQEAMAAEGEAKIDEQIAAENRALLTTPFEATVETPRYERTKPKSRRCKKCGATKTYVYHGSPRWHFVGHNTYCHRCYSKLFRKR